MAKKSQASQLIALCADNFKVYRDSTRASNFAVRNDAPHVAVPITARAGHRSLASDLRRAYFDETGRTCNDTQLKQALAVVEASVEEERPTYLRAKQVERGDHRTIYIDLANNLNQVIEIRDGVWRLRDGAPGVIFRRTAVTRAFKPPTGRGAMPNVREYFGLSRRDWALVRAWLVMAWMTEIPVPILAIMGPSGSGKTFLAKLLMSLVDPGATFGRTPRDEREWAVQANIQRVLAFDNLSKIAPWLSDAICRAVTGDSFTERELYTNEDVVVFEYRRAMLFTAIDAGALRDDLSERLMAIEFKPMSDMERLTEREMDARIEHWREPLLAGLLGLVAEVLAHRARRPAKLPRMADAAMEMAAIDELRPRAHTASAYASSSQNLTSIVLESDPLAAALRSYVNSRNGDLPWNGTATELLEALHPYKEKNWPANARSLSARLKRLEQPLTRAQWLKIEPGRNRNDRLWVLDRWR
jgi:hypothetical protein